MSNEDFMAFCDKRFSQDDLVIAHSLGPTMVGEFNCTIRGISGCEPFESYIVEWSEPKSVQKFYPKEKFWTHSVLPKGCLRLA